MNIIPNEVLFALFKQYLRMGGSSFEEFEKDSVIGQIETYNKFLHFLKSTIKHGRD